LEEVTLQLAKSNVHQS